MTRDVLVGVLGQAPGVSQKGEAFEVAEDHALTLYLGRPGQAMEVAEVRRCELADGVVRAVAGASETVYFVELEAIHAVAVRPPAAERERRTGF